MELFSQQLAEFIGGDVRLFEDSGQGSFLQFFVIGNNYCCLAYRMMKFSYEAVLYQRFNRIFSRDIGEFHSRLPC